MLRVSLLSFVAAVAMAFATAGEVAAQSLYLADGTNLRTYNPADDSVTAAIPITGLSGMNTGLAMHPTTGTMYIVTAAQDRLATVNLSTGATTNLGALTQRMRGIVFDNSGKLWGVTGSASSSPNALVSINVATNAVTVEDASLPVSRLKIAYNPGTDTLYLLGYTGTGWNLYSVAPTTPTTQTPLALTGASLGNTANNQPGMVFDTTGNRILMGHITTGVTADLVAITPAGVVTTTASNKLAGNFGLAYDLAAPSAAMNWSRFE